MKAVGIQKQPVFLHHLGCLPAGAYFDSAATTQCTHDIHRGKLALHLYLLRYPEEYTYLLPAQELAAKHLAISAYNGSFSMKKLNDLGVNEESIKESLDFLISKELLSGDADRFYVAKVGFAHYGAVFSILYSKD